jgi:hypothetical protein
VAAKQPTKKLHKWEITLIRECGEFLGFVEAADEKAATLLESGAL